MRNRRGGRRGPWRARLERPSAELTDRYGQGDRWAMTQRVADDNRLLFKLVSEPEREWRQLSGVAW